MKTEVNNVKEVMENIITRKLSKVQVKLFDTPLPKDKDGFPIGFPDMDYYKGQMNILCEVLFDMNKYLEVN
jgi:hypothetical protein